MESFPPPLVDFLNDKQILQKCKAFSTDHHSILKRLRALSELEAPTLLVCGRRFCKPQITQIITDLFTPKKGLFFVFFVVSAFLPHPGTQKPPSKTELDL